MSPSPDLIAGWEGDSAVSILFIGSSSKLTIPGQGFIGFFFRLTVPRQKLFFGDFCFQFFHIGWHATIIDPGRFVKGREYSVGGFGRKQARTVFEIVPPVADSKSQRCLV